jgi:hypothetical protein
LLNDFYILSLDFDGLFWSFAILNTYDLMFVNYVLILSNSLLLRTGVWLNLIIDDVDDIGDYAGEVGLLWKILFFDIVSC